MVIFVCCSVDCCVCIAVCAFMRVLRPAGIRKVIDLGGEETCARISKQEQGKDIQTMEVRGTRGKEDSSQQGGRYLVVSLVGLERHRISSFN